VSTESVEILGKAFEAIAINHHLAHAAIVHAFDVDDFVIDVCDGGGDFGDAHFTYRSKNHRVEPLENRPIHDAFSSRFYDVVSRYLYGAMSCEGKLMALASLGTPRPDMLEFLRQRLNLFHRAPTAESHAALARSFPVTSYVKSRTAYDLAASAQRLFEDLRVESVRELPRDAPNVLLAGGATLNILANSRVREWLGPGRTLFVPPCCDDTGQSLGALLYLCHEKLGVPVTANMPFLGYGDRLGESTLSAEDATDELVSFLAEGGIVFLHRGPSEIGPRALGHRSILAVPSRRSYDVINHLIKQREFYRPLAPLVPLEEVAQWFEWEGESRYMLYAATVREAARVRAPGICHYDGSARLQTVASAEDPFLHALLRRVGQATSCPLLINTSLNPKGAPILSRVEATHAFAASSAELGVRVFHEGRLY
ncbi:MAG TPA: carbamoyltransferase C-terminal domain-containing protein, partial [Polyangiaceae bacterium]